MLRNLSTFFLRTLREDPADAEVNSHKLLVRAGYIRRCAPGIYTWLPLGLRTLRKIEDIVREEMDAMGAQEVHFPGLIPADPYKATNRWEEYGTHGFEGHRHSRVTPHQGMKPVRSPRPRPARAREHPGLPRSSDVPSTPGMPTQAVPPGTGTESRRRS